MHGRRSAAVDLGPSERGVPRAGQALPRVRGLIADLAILVLMASIGLTVGLLARGHSHPVPPARPLQAELTVPDGTALLAWQAVAPLQWSGARAGTVTESASAASVR